MPESHTAKSAQTLRAAQIMGVVMLEDAMETLPRSPDLPDDRALQRQENAVNYAASLRPRDAFEATLVTHLTAANNAATEAFRLAAKPDLPLALRLRIWTKSEKLARLGLDLTEALQAAGCAPAWGRRRVPAAAATEPTPEPAASPAPAQAPPGELQPQASAPPQPPEQTPAPAQPTPAAAAGKTPPAGTRPATAAATLRCDPVPPAQTTPRPHRPILLDPAVAGMTERPHAT